MRSDVSLLLYTGKLMLCSAFWFPASIVLILMFPLGGNIIQSLIFQVWFGFPLFVIGGVIGCINGILVSMIVHTFQRLVPLRIIILKGLLNIVVISSTCILGYISWELFLSKIVIWSAPLSYDKVWWFVPTMVLVITVWHHRLASRLIFDNDRKQKI